VISVPVETGLPLVVKQTVRRIARLNPEVRVVVTGCYATRRPGEHLKPVFARSRRKLERG